MGHVGHFELTHITHPSIGTPLDAYASVIAAAKSPALCITDDASDCPPSNDSPPPVQRLGSMSIPSGSWTLLRLDPPDAVILHVGAEQLRIVAAGRWTPEEPEP